MVLLVKAVSPFSLPPPPPPPPLHCVLASSSLGLQLSQLMAQEKGDEEGERLGPSYTRTVYMARGGKEKEEEEEDVCLSHQCAPLLLYDAS